MLRIAPYLSASSFDFTISVSLTRPRPTMFTHGRTRLLAKPPAYFSITRAFSLTHVSVDSASEVWPRWTWSNVRRLSKPRSPTLGIASSTGPGL